MIEENRKKCFVIAPIGEPGSDTRTRSDLVLRRIVRPAVEAKGYVAIRADEIAEPGIITSQIIQHVVEDELVIADLTEQNPNVFYEMAVRHVFRRPLVQIIERDERIPFDVAATRTVFIDHHNPDCAAVRTEIEEQITTLEAANSVASENPISAALDLRRLRRVDNPGNSSLDPSQVLSLVWSTVTGDDHIETMPLLLSYMRQDLPWAYDLGMEGYKRFWIIGDRDDGRRFFSRLAELIDLTGQSLNIEPDLHFLLMELRKVLGYVIRAG